MRKNRNPAAAATAGGAEGFDLAGSQIRPVATPKRPPLQGQRIAAPIRIDVAPTESGRKWRAIFDSKVLCTAAAPLVKAARILIAKGHDPSRLIEVSRQHAAHGPCAANLVRSLRPSSMANARPKGMPRTTRPFDFRGNPRSSIDGRAARDEQQIALEISHWINRNRCCRTAKAATSTTKCFFEEMNK
jgi:hypothetical protein